jgi:hypothetical protein
VLSEGFHAKKRCAARAADVDLCSPPVAKRPRVRLAAATPDKTLGPSTKGQKLRPQGRSRRSKRIDNAAGCVPCGIDAGTVHETNEEHLRRHTGLIRRSCPRCFYVGRQAALERCATSIAGVMWLSPRPTFLGGSWALGCCICGAARKAPAIVQARKERRTGSPCHRAFGRSGCKFACYEVCRPLGKYGAAGALMQHGASKAHAEALKLLDSAENHLRFAEVVQVDTLTSAGESVFQGHVPQPEAWKNAWAENTSRISFNKQQTLAKKKGETREGACLRKQRTKQLAVQAEVARATCRKRLRESTNICLSMDNGKARKVLRVRCDTAGPPYSFGGVVGYVDTGYATLEEITEDHGKLAVDKLRAFFEGFFTPLGCDTREEGALEDFVSKVRVLCADGASEARKVLFLTAVALFVNLRMVIRDPAHAIRKALEPMHFDDLFGQVWHEIADRKHALLPDIMHSPKNQHILQAIQETYAVSIPNEARPMQVVLKHLSFAKLSWRRAHHFVGRVPFYVHRN